MLMVAVTKPVLAVDCVEGLIALSHVSSPRPAIMLDLSTGSLLWDSLAATALVVIALWGLTRVRFAPKRYRPYPLTRVLEARADPTRDGFSATKIPPRVDHVIIGSGISGLTTAAYLSRLGHVCLVLVSAHVPRLISW